MRLRDWFSRSDKEFEEEIREHIAMETQANIGRGMSPEDAARAARVSFGSISGTRQQLSEGRRSYWLSTVTQDFYYAVRAIRRNMLLSVAVAFTLSVGIGLTTAIFSLINAVAFHPPVSVDSASFVMVLQDSGSGQQRRIASVPVYERLRSQVRSVRELAAWSGQLRLSAPLGSTDTGRVDGWLTSCNFFSVFNDEPPRLGRFFQEDDCAMSLPVIVISERVWRDRFASDPQIIGKSIAYGGQPMTVIGVAVPPKLVDESAPGLWLPYTSHPSLKAFAVFPFKRDWLRDESFAWLQLAGRLQPGHTREAAQAELKVLLEEGVPRDSRRNAQFRLTDGSLWTMFPGDMLWLFALALAFPTLVMWIVCATVATLLLSRAVSRRREMAVRLALGGGRFRLVQMLLAESLLLSMSAGLLSLVFVFKLPSLLMTFLSIANAPTLSVSPDWRVFSYMAVVTILTAVLSGLTPALESLNTHLGESLKGREVLAKRRGRSLLRHGLIGVQVAFSMVLLVTAATLLRSEQQGSRVGFETRQVVYADFPQAVAQNAELQASLATSLQSLPGVRAIAFSNSIPSLYESSTSFVMPGQGAQTVATSDVSPEYFSTLEIPILSGRTLIDAETVVVSERFAQRFFPQQNPLGQTFQVDGEDRRLRIVGVARDKAGTGRDGSFVYQWMKPQSDVFLLARFDGSSAAFAQALQSALKARTGMVLSVGTLQSRLDERMSALHGVELLLLAMGIVALTLVLVGVYGIVAFSAAQRKRDFAIRVALGARRSGIFGAVVSAGLRPIPIAILAGAILSFGSLRLIHAQGLFPAGRSSMDPLPYVASATVLLLAIFAALALPARRAMSSDPVDALREE